MQVMQTSPLVRRALEFASVKHQGQFRKHPTQKIPYISHPVSVGLMLARAGYDDEVVAAGVLHDVVEDCGVKLEELNDIFGPRVARLVDQVSEPSKELSWETRKGAYRKKLETADKEALAIAAADHLHNLESLADTYAVDPSVTKFFKVTMDKKMEHERLCSKIIGQRLDDSLAKDLASFLVKNSDFAKA
jgi:(p)ppGpp synthase/HD superfamily hydrolase